MKLLIVAFLIPFVYGDLNDDCPPWPKDPVVCKGSDLTCGGDAEEDAQGCMPPHWCLAVDPYAHCSAKAACPFTCPQGSIKCPGGKDMDGCPMPDTCEPELANCPTNCPLHCGPNEMMCPGEVDPKGCQLPGSCQSKIDDDGLPAHCPVHCAEGMMPCPPGFDENGYPLPDICLPFDAKAECYTYCPTHCPPNSLMCPMGKDANGCQIPDTCIGYDPTTICKTTCPPICSEGERPCSFPGETGKDEWGCYMPTVCSVKGT